FFFSSRRRHTRFSRDWSSDVCSSDLEFSAADREQMIERARHIRDLGEKGSRHRVSKSPHADGQYRQLMPSPPKTGGREMLADHRSEERRVGKEWRLAGMTYQCKQTST